MRKLIAVVVCLALPTLALSAIPETTDLTKLSQPKAAKTAAAKRAAAQDGAGKSKPKHYYVKVTPLAASPMAATPALHTQTAAPEAAQLKAAAPEAGQVHTGHMVCELGNSVTVMPHPQEPSNVVVQMKKTTYHMMPVETSTGAVRFEDAQAGAVWLQLPHKSMLMNSKLGQRMADECQSEHQIAVAQRMKLDPPPSLLDQPTLANK